MRSTRQDQPPSAEAMPKKVPAWGVACAAAGFVAVGAIAWWTLSYVVCQGSFAGLAGEGPCGPSDAVLPILTIPAAGIGGGIAWWSQRWWPLLLGAAVTFLPLIAFPLIAR